MMERESCCCYLSLVHGHGRGRGGGDVEKRDLGHGLGGGLGVGQDKDEEDPEEKNDQGKTCKGLQLNQTLPLSALEFPKYLAQTFIPFCAWLLINGLCIAFQILTPTDEQVMPQLDYVHVERSLDLQEEIQT